MTTRYTGARNCPLSRSNNYCLRFLAIAQISDKSDSALQLMEAFSSALLAAPLSFFFFFFAF